jgi:Cu(I)/Ag(I) efflux system membrane protein CusA/SilA
MRWRRPPALSVTLIPVLMGYWIRGRIPDEQRNPITRALIASTDRRWNGCCAGRRLTLVMAVVLAEHGLAAGAPGRRVPAAAGRGRPAVHALGAAGAVGAEGAELLQITNRMIKTVPEVERVFGKAGRAETATDPAPLEMFETTVKLKPREQWRPGMTPERWSRSSTRR